MKVIITGGCGFIGVNAAGRHLKRGDRVVLIDDLSRAGSKHNLAWLKRQGKVAFERLDVRDAGEVRRTLRKHKDAGLILHLAGQVAVTTSVADPRCDFETNALGSFNVLEGARLAGIKAPMIYSSTNKVYGEMDRAGVALRGGRYAYARLPHGIDEGRPLDFHSPYGCSKGAADQYFRDYHRIYGLNTVVMRQSCVYGYRQFGVEDQGWVAWFAIATLLERPITVYGDGRQTRDVLFIDDLLDAYDAAAARIKTAAGQVYNIGGGPGNVLSLLDLLAALEDRRGRRIPFLKAAWRPGDQRVYVSDIRKAGRDLGWKPKIGREAGLALIDEWIASNRGLFSR